MSDSDNSAHSKIREHVARTVSCRHCETEFNAQDIYVLGRRAEYWCVAISCPRCLRQGIMFLQTPFNRSHSEAIELTEEEWERFEEMPAIDENDVDSMKSALHELRKDISELWEE